MIYHMTTDRVSLIQKLSGELVARSWNPCESYDRRGAQDLVICLSFLVGHLNVPSQCCGEKSGDAGRQKSALGKAWGEWGLLLALKPTMKFEQYWIMIM